MSDLEAYAAAVLEEVPEDSKLNRISTLALKQLELERKLTELNDTVAKTTEELKQVAEVDLPNALTDAGMLDFTLLDGSKIGIEEKLIASVPKDQKSDFFGWLVEHNHGDLIKRTVEIAFGRGERAIAEKVLEYLRTTYPKAKVSDNEDVHWQTLRSFVREQLAKDVVLPPSLYVDRPRRAVITVAEKKSAPNDPGF